MSERSYVVHIFGLDRERGAVVVPIMDFVMYSMALIRRFGNDKLAFRSEVMGQISAKLRNFPTVNPEGTLQSVALDVLALESLGRTTFEFDNLHGFLVQAGEGFFVEPFSTREMAAFEIRILAVRAAWTSAPGRIHVDPRHPPKAG